MKCGRKGRRQKVYHRGDVHCPSRLRATIRARNLKGVRGMWRRKVHRATAARKKGAKPEKADRGPEATPGQAGEKAEGE